MIFANAMLPRGFRRSGFSLIELVVVIGIIGIMMSFLLPSLQGARENARYVQCCSNLRQIGMVTNEYASREGGYYPDASLTGNFSFRMQPGMLTPNDPSAKPEVYGVQAVFESKRLIEATKGLWRCPSSPDWMRKYNNTYAFSIAATLSGKVMPLDSLSTTTWVWDNYTLYPGLSGFRGPFNGYTIPVESRQYPHQLRSKSGSGYNVLYLDGHVEYKSL